MKDLLIGLLQMTISSGILYGYYYLCLRNKRFHQYNRFYLLGILVISILIPFLNIPIYFTNNDAGVFQALQQMSLTGKEMDSLNNGLAPHRSFNWNMAWYAAYGLVSLIFIARIIISLRRLNSLIKHNPVEELNGVHFVNTNEPGTPFSFLRWLFWDKKIDLHSEKGEQVFRHEIFHIQQKHSLDILFTELVSAICWFNPFFHLVRKELKAIHEFLADRFAVTESRKWEYAELLLMQALDTRHSLVNPFFHNQIKRRIAMITSSKKPSYQYLRKLLVLPVAALTIGLFAFQYKSKDDRLDAEITPLVLPGALNDTVPSKASYLVAVKDTLRIHTVEGKLVPLKAGQAVTGQPGMLFLIGDTTRTTTGILIRDKNELPLQLQGTVKNVEVAASGHAVDTNIILKLKKAEPLYVVNGKVLEKVSSREALKTIRPEDIMAVTVLKDKSAVDKYGRNAVNGVIEITTKSGDAIPGAKEVTLDLSEVVVSEYGTKSGVKQVNDNVLFEKVEIDPSFAGGKAAWRQFVERALDASLPSSQHAPDGEYTVWIRFLVDKDGDLSDFKALTNHGFGMEQEAIRLLKESPRWLPGIQNGKKVSAYTKQAVLFTVGKITGSSPTNGLTMLYPNPANQTLTIRLEAAQAGDGLISIADLSGKVRQVTEKALVRGTNNINVNTSSLTAGTYIVSVIDSNKKLLRSYKLIKE